MHLQKCQENVLKKLSTPLKLVISLMFIIQTQQKDILQLQNKTQKNSLAVTIFTLANLFNLPEISSVK